jgi:hypothetical protein
MGAAHCVDRVKPIQRSTSQPFVCGFQQLARRSQLSAGAMTTSEVVPISFSEMDASPVGLALVPAVLEDCDDFVTTPDIRNTARVLRFPHPNNDNSPCPLSPATVSTVSWGQATHDTSLPSQDQASRGGPATVAIPAKVMHFCCAERAFSAHSIGPVTASASHSGTLAFNAKRSRIMSAHALHMDPR